MKKSTRIRFITMILIVILMVITVLSSCSADNSSPILCNVKLDYDNSRDFKELSLISNLSKSTLFYKANYLGSGSSYGSTTDYVSYPDGGLILSQGLWQIDCKWMNGDTLIAEGTTRDIWVNLNTTSILVYLEENVGTGSFSLESYKVNCSDSSVSSVSYDVLLCKYTESLGSNLLSTSEYNTGTETDCISTLNITKNDLEAGAYLLTIKVFNGNTQTNENLLFTDVLGFIVRGGQQTTVKGHCYIKKGTYAKNEYIEWEPNPSQPSTENGKVIEAGNGNASTDSTADITKHPIKNETIYIIQEDKVTNNDGTVSGTGNMDLSTDGKNETGPRLVTPNSGVNFGINMNGKNVVLSTYNGPYDFTNSENTTVVQLNNNTEMTLFNYVLGNETNQPNTWGTIEDSNFLRRYHANADILGGTLNIIGPRNNSISNIPIVFQGPSCDDSNNYSSAGFNTYYKQGSININSPGGTIVADGDVTIKGHVGVSSWNADMGPTTTIKGESDINISLKKGATIESIGDYHTGKNISGTITIDYSDTAYGIKLVGDSSSTGSINITLDKGHISTSNKDKSIVPSKKSFILTNEACIYIENYSGNISIDLKNASSLISESGTAIKLIDCTGNVSISVSDSTIKAKTPLIISGSRPNSLSLNGISE